MGSGSEESWKISKERRPKEIGGAVHADLGGFPPPGVWDRRHVEERTGWPFLAYLNCGSALPRPEEPERTWENMDQQRPHSRSPRKHVRRRLVDAPISPRKESYLALVTVEKRPEGRLHFLSARHGLTGNAASRFDRKRARPS